MDRWGPVGVGMVLGVALWPGWPVGADVAFGVACLGMALRVLSGFRRAPRGLRHVAGVGLGLGLGLASVASLPPGPRLRGPVAIVGIVRGAPMGRTADVAVARWRPRAGAWRAEDGGVVRARLPFPGVAPGDEIVLFGDGRPVDDDVLPGAPDPVRAARMGRVRTLVQVHTARVLGPAPSPPRRAMHGLLRALATGSREDVQPAWIDVLRGTGTAHLLAISGFHVGTVAAVAWFAAQRLAGLLAIRWPRGISLAWVRLPPVAAAVAFAAAVGWPVSAQRAVLLVALVALKSVVGRPLSPLAGLGLAAAGVIVVDPSAVAGPSFQLSFGAVLGLATWGRVGVEELGGPWWVKRVGEGLWVSVAATIGTLPAAAWWFQAVAPTSPVANLLAMPWTAVVLAPCAFAATWVPGWPGDAAAWLGSLAADGLLTVLGALVVEPWRPAVGPVGALLLCALFGLSRWPVLAMAWTGLVLGLRAVPVDHIEVTFLDIGQGSAAFVAFGDGRRWLVDGGRAWPGVDGWLRRQGVGRLHRVVLSHPDDDHAGGLEAVLKTLQVDALHVAGEVPEALARAAAARGVPIVDDARLRWHPGDPAQWEDNDRSVVLSVEGGALDLLLPGDIEATAEAVVAERVPAHALLALPHHGSSTSTTATLLDAVRPGLAIAQAGRDNRYGHPHRRVQARLAARGVRLLRTDVLGTIHLTWREDRVAIAAWRAGLGWRTLRPWQPEVRPPVLASATPRPPGPAR